MLDVLFNPFLWDRGVYKFNRLEKDMSPYSVHRTDNGIVLVHNVIGINKEDLSVKIVTEEGESKLIISGETNDEETDNKYSIHSEFVLDSSKKIKSVSSNSKNGLLYIDINYDNENKSESVEIVEIK